LNVYSNLSTVAMASGYPMLKCLTTLKNQGVACVAPANANAIAVRQSTQVPMYFAALFGYSSMTVTATATAEARGASPSPYNVAIIVDSTASMNSLDSDSSCNSTRIGCALAGVRILLSTLSPCAASQASCGTATNGNVANSVDKVSLFTFPGVSSTTQAQNDYNCSGASPTISPYSYPTLPTYQIVNFSSDYRTSDTSTLLTASSNIVAAAGGKSTCNGLQAIGGEGTYYAGVIYATQAALMAAKTPSTQNVLILLSDGDANAKSSAMPGASTTSGVYPSTKNQCQQAVAAAQTAAAAGTRVYSVAYGATSSGCSTDNGAITPCQTMQNIASSPQYFFSDYTATGSDGTCISAAQPTTSLSQIFTQIAGDLTVSRLIPDNTP
jgi:hypothetical protein